ncbi:MAG: hypothetical protein ACP5E3_18010, partial [Bacteroidales bacterium]
MTYKEIIEKHHNIVQLVSEKRISEAFRLLEKLTETLRNVDYRTRLSNNEETYRNILTYSFEQGDDPEKENVYDRLVKSVLELTDEVKDEIILQENLLSYFKLKERQNIEFESRFEETEKWIQKVSLEAETEMVSGDLENMKPGDPMEVSVNEQALRFFRFFWLNDKLHEREIKLAEEIVKSEKFPWFYKSLFVSALTLSSLM